MSEIRVKENESLEQALRRFKRQCARAGVLWEVRKRELRKAKLKEKEKIRSCKKEKIQIVFGLIYRIISFERRYTNANY